MLTPQAIQGIQFVFNVSFFFFRIELGTKTHGFRYFWVFLGNALKAYCDWVVNFRTSLVMNVRTLTRESSLFQPTLTVFTVAVASLFLATPSQAFSLRDSQGNIQFSAYDVGNGVGQPTSQTKSGSLPLSDTWSDPRGSGNVAMAPIALLDFGGIVWYTNGSSVVLNDENHDDSLAVRIASSAEASFETTVTGEYERFVWLIIGVSIDLTKADAWVTGSAIGSFETPGLSTPFQIAFGFDGANRGGQDFINMSFLGNTYAGVMDAGANSFSAVAGGIVGDNFQLNEGDNVSVQGTFTCNAFNGACSNVSIRSVPWETDALSDFSR